jgi:hypothetical protein
LIRAGSGVRGKRRSKGNGGRAMRATRDGERGEGRLGTMFGLMVLAVTVYLGFKILPVMINAYAFRDYIETETRFAALRNKDEEVIKRVVRKAEELDLPVTTKNITVNRSQVYFDIKVDYTIPIETPVYTYNWVFNEQYRATLF